MVRPKAEDLAHRCSGTNARGDRCGSPAMDGAALCAAHLVGRAERRKLSAVGDRLVAMTASALDRLEAVIEHGTDETAVKAARVVLDRTMPKPSSAAAVVVNLPGVHGPMDAGPGMPPSEIIARRLAELEPAALRAMHAPEATDPDGIVDAVLVEDP